MNAMSDPLTDYHRDLSPADVVRAELLPREIEQALGVSRSTVWRWSQPKGRGTGGLVPSQYHGPLMMLARRLGRKLTTEDLVLGRNRTDKEA